VTVELFAKPSLVRTWYLGSSTRMLSWVRMNDDQMLRTAHGIMVLDSEHRPRGFATSHVTPVSISCVVRPCHNRGTSALQSLQSNASSFARAASSLHIIIIDAYPWSISTNLQSHLPARDQREPGSGHHQDGRCDECSISLEHALFTAGTLVVENQFTLLSWAETASAILCSIFPFTGANVIQIRRIWCSSLGLVSQAASSIAQSCPCVGGTADARVTSRS
jgi:hypothetical protein